MRRVLLLLVPLFLTAQPKISPEIERTESMIQQLTELKAKVSAIESQIDGLIAALSEQRGALASTKSYNALEHVQDSPADPKKTSVRCAAVTSKGARCSRPAVEGSRYCKQHQLAHAK
ncbi:MAG: hypothetical protein IT161_17620 [Bryobacterales bacterium]|nr:hypothetical protein [Bryobacterales bacterium]